MTGTALKNNAASGKTNYDGGGAVYSNNNRLILSGVVMDGNSTGFYGGAVSALGAELTIDNGSQFKNNTGATAPAIYLRDGGSCTMTDVSVTDNIGTNGNGTLYITGAGTLTITRLTASGNRNSNGGVLYSSGSGAIVIDSSELTNNAAVNNGGVIDYRGSGSLTVTGTTISGNTARIGGVVHTSGTGSVSIRSSALTGNSATGQGGAVYATGSGNVAVSDNCTVSSNTAPTGGAVYLDKGASVEISGSTMESNSATTDFGGAIMIADSSTEGTAATTLTLTNVTLTNNTAVKKGGALSTDTSSPNLVIQASGCSFVGNKTTSEGAGAVEIQNGNCTSAQAPASLNLVFTNCTFTNNTAKTTGGAVEIRTSSCARFDGITATGNSSPQNGAGIYVTSNFSRLYLTVDVSCSNNISEQSGDSFIYLYNNSYTNPPKIYTSYGSDAPWYSVVKGNSGSIEFGVTQMP